MELGPTNKVSACRGQTTDFSQSAPFTAGNKATFALCAYHGPSRSSLREFTMKPTAIIGYALLNFMLLCTAFGQSSFYLNNYSPQAINAPVFDALGDPLQGPNYLVELWGGATPDSLTPAIAYYSRQRVVIPFQSPAGAGYFLDSYVGRDGADHPSILSVPTAGWVWLEVRAWDARLGATYEEVAALAIGGYGSSSPFYAQGGNPLDLLGSPARLLGLQSFSLLAIIPEPSTWALLALGGTAVCWVARRQRRR